MKLTLSEKELLTDNVWAFRFTSDESLTWEPGQFVQVELPHEQPDAEGTKRWFTVSSAPYESIIQITTRVTQSTFKQALAALAVGGELALLASPDGDFTWAASAKPLVFVAGGIGITPFRSMLKQRFHDHQPVAVTLIYSGRTGDLPFKDELDEWSKGDSALKIHYVIGERLTADKLQELEPLLEESMVYVSGPEPMVEALGAQLRDAGIREDHLKEDFFPNYTENNY